MELIQTLDFLKERDDKEERLISSNPFEILLGSASREREHERIANRVWNQAIASSTRASSNAVDRATILKKTSGIFLPADADAIEKAINEGCEKIDARDW